MIEWTDDAIVLSARRHGETAAIVSLLTRAHGRHAGLVHGGAGGCWPATEMFRILETHSDPYFIQATSTEIGAEEVHRSGPSGVRQLFVVAR